MRLLGFLCAALLALFVTREAQASVTIKVDKTTQTMDVNASNGTVYHWKISSGRRGYETPKGTYKPYRMHTMWRSKKYQNAPMPHSIFFHGGYAIHGTTAVANLGNVASHGCIRLHPKDAKALFDLVKADKDTTDIVIDASPAPVKPAVAIAKTGDGKAKAKMAKAKQHRAKALAAAKAKVKMASASPVTSRGDDGSIFGVLKYSKLH
jgi:hypothetical protein